MPRSTWETLVAREEALAGARAPAVDVEQRVAAIERRVAYLLAQSRHVVSAFFDGTLISEGATDRLAVDASLDGPLPPTALSRFAEFWRDLLPEGLEQRAELCIALSRKHVFELDDPDVRLTLGLDDPELVWAFAAAYGQPPEELLRAASCQILLACDDDLPPHSGDLRAEAEAVVEWVYIRAGQRLFRQGDQADALYVVVSC